MGNMPHQTRLSVIGCNEFLLRTDHPYTAEGMFEIFTWNGNPKEAEEIIQQLPTGIRGYISKTGKTLYFEYEDVKISMSDGASILIYPETSGVYVYKPTSEDQRRLNL